MNIWAYCFEKNRRRCSFQTHLFKDNFLWVWFYDKKREILKGNLLNFPENWLGLSRNELLCTLVINHIVSAKGFQLSVNWSKYQFSRNCSNFNKSIPNLIWKEIDQPLLAYRFCDRNIISFGENLLFNFCQLWAVNMVKLCSNQFYIQNINLALLKKVFIYLFIYFFFSLMNILWKYLLRNCLKWPKITLKGY